MRSEFTARDRDLYERRGGDPDELERQLAILRQPPPPVALLRACRLGDGIDRLDPAVVTAVETSSEAALSTPVKFVPASGAATRMFSFLPSDRGRGSTTLAALRTLAGEGDDAARATLDLLASIDRLPVLPQLADLLQSREPGEWHELRDRDPGLLLQLLADPEGLALADTAKGLLPFHRYQSGCRTAFEEHLHEGIGYLSDGSSPARFHFTVAAEHREAFHDLASELAPRLASHYGIDIEVEFSLQNPRTDTIALDSDGLPLRDGEGRLVLRPAGHGALLENLQRLAESGRGMVFLKNIDNIAPARFHAEVVRSKRLLAALLGELRRETRDLLDSLDAGEPGAARRAISLLQRRFASRLPDSLERLDEDEQRRLLRDRLDRPLRVCGVVANRGEPGGGPFWIGRSDGAADGQIVEYAQVDHQDPEQQQIWASSTHFNPVDIVCWLHDRAGAPYELSRFVDRSTYFVAEKVHEGRTVRVLERPGLWNGAMAGWNTAFVEVPDRTFTPVKTLLDLLRPEHQA